MRTTVEQVAAELARLADVFEDRSVNPTDNASAFAWKSVADELRDYVRSLPCAVRVESGDEQ